MHLDRLTHDMHFSHSSIGFVGRPAIHSFATGAPSCHKKEAEALWKQFDSKMWDDDIYI